MIFPTPGEDKLPKELQEKLNDELALSLVEELSEDDALFSLERLSYTRKPASTI